ncbi:hypothetical protein Vretimale_9746 [Volvox reticuliferus]|uniref:Uncharacterized protein n=1 Tax=Volvox reticuliferus TaxID=1737510 RepID=A0A8J4GE63_9CHLO|nr:hypothetical protein Vretifemale_13493 [Volvox reticuliferus]GIM05290.1 hypothetical protein Vretimale_9746 [Volvox reticuliferus]
MESGDATVLRPARPLHVSSLQECCVNTLTKYRQYLGDVGFMDAESLRSVLWHCNPTQLAHIEDETLVGSDRNLEWYTWHLWKRLLEADFGDGGLQAPELESEKPVDYVPPRGISDDPADYRTLYLHRKEELEAKTAAAKERIAAAVQQVQEAKESRKAKMIDKLATSKRARSSSGASRVQTSSVMSAYMHKPRADSRSSVMSKPGAQLKLLSELGLVKKAPPRSTTTVRIIKPSPVPSAAVGHSSSLAGAQLLSKATGGNLGKTSVGNNRGMHIAAQTPQVAARAAAVAAVAAARTTPTSSPSGTSAAGLARSSHLGSSGSKGRPLPLASQGEPKGSTKRLADGPFEPEDPPPSKRSAAKAPGLSGGGGSPDGGGEAGPPRADPRIMFPRQAPPAHTPGQSKFAVPTVRPVTASASPGSPVQQQQPRRAGAGAPGARTGGANKALTIRPADDL